MTNMHQLRKLSVYSVLIIMMLNKLNRIFVLKSASFSSFLRAAFLLVLVALTSTGCHNQYRSSYPYAINNIEHNRSPFIKSLFGQDIPYANDLLSDVYPRAYYDVKIRSFDGTLLKATIYQPALSPGESAPLIIHSHSFSTFRMSKPMSMYGTLMFSGKTALKLWEQGYWVISYDQRGHGGSTGKIQLMSPDHEVRDVSAVIDWATEHLPRIKLATPDPSATQLDPVIGMLGESYSGSLQLLASIQDPRIDAIVPIHTWYSLTDSLSPNDIPKGWLTTLIITGNALNPYKVAPLINQGYKEAVQTGTLSDAFSNILDSRSFKYYCDQRQMPHADAFVMQGFNDTLFNVNQGLWIRDCLERAGRDVRFLGTQKGHVLPLAQQDGFMPFHDVEPKVHCDQNSFDTQQMVLDWFDEKLKQKSKQANYIPKLCLTVNKTYGKILDAFPVGGQTFSFDQVKLHSGLAGMLELPFTPIDWISNALTFKQKTTKTDPKSSGGWLRPSFSPLTRTNSDTILLGIPTMNIDVSTNKGENSKKNRVYIGLGILKPGDAKFQLLSKQVTPVPGNGKHHLMLSGISEMIPAGSTLGLVVYGYSNQYRFSYSGLRTKAKLSGEIQLPLLDYNTPMNSPSALAL